MAVQARGSIEVDALEATRAAAIDPTRQPGMSAEPTLVGNATAPSALEAAEPAIGDEVGRYRITGRIGAGGMGVVFRAYDPQLDREVALKLLLAGSSGGTEGRSRLLREAQAAAKIHHPNVVTVYDAGEVAGRVFIAMELIDGVTLKAWLRRPGRPWQDVLRVLLSAGEGLAAAHEVGLVHRDFKPDNVLIGADGRAHVLDFGLARPALEVAQANDPTPASGRAIAREAMLQTLTQTGMTIGTPAYMAPEQHLARPTSARSDQFSFCVATYEALYGQRPFVGENYAELSLAVIEGRVVPPPRRTPVPAPVWQALRRGLQPAPEARFSGLTELLAELGQVLRPGVLGARVGIVAAVLSLPVIAVLGAMALDSDADPAPPAPPVEAEPIAQREGPPEPSRPPEVAPERPEEPGVELMTTEAVELSAVRALFDPLLPDGKVRMEARGDRLVLVGAGAQRWKAAIDQMLQSIDESGRAVELFTAIETPDGRRWSGFELAPEGFEKRVAAIRELEAVEAVVPSRSLGVVLVRGTFKAQEAVSRWLKRQAEPAPRKRWCYVNGALPECKDTLQACEVNAISWEVGEEAAAAAAKTKLRRKYCDAEK